MQYEPRSRGRRVLLRLFALFLGFAAAGLLTEIVFSSLLYLQDRRHCEGTCFRPELDARWGWRLAPGPYRLTTSEFDTSGVVNELHMNDGHPYDAAAEADATRVLALGDSHTAAVGVSSDETWVAILEQRLNERYRPHRFVCHNTGTQGYSLHQYLVRLLDQGEALRPHFVVVGFSFATDLYDLLPPDRGGWSYGGEAPRVYWDLDSGSLVEEYWTPDGGTSGTRQTRPLAFRLRGFLDHFATFRYLRRSPLALAIGARVQPGGKSLWPNMEVVVEREPSPMHRYQHQLAFALLRKLNDESRRLGAKLIVVGIPYLPQVYDEVWDATFGNEARYSPTAASERLRRFLREQGIPYIDTRDSLHEAARIRGHWLHHRRDGHPTAEGQSIIAEAVVEADVVAPRLDTGS